MARRPQGDRDRRGGRRARASDRRQRDPERDAAGCARQDRARLRARDDGLSALSSEPARRAHGGPGRGLDGALHPPAHAADARHGGRDRSGRSHRRAEILSLSRRRLAAGNRDRRRSRGRAAAARELRRARRGRFRQRQSGERAVHAILLRRRLRGLAPGRSHGRQLHGRRRAHRNPLRAHRAELRPQSDAAARRRGGQLHRLRAPRRPAAHPLGGAERPRPRRAAAFRPAAPGAPGRSAPAQLSHDPISDSLMPAPEKSAQSPSGPAQVLSLGDATAIIVGLIIGAGIFKTPSIVAGSSGGETAMLLAWFAGGAVSLIGAMCYAELATAYPSAGGEYHFIGRAFGRVPAFFYAWARMTVIVAGSIAVFSFVFGVYCARLFSFGEHSSSIYAALIVVVLTVVNIIGIQAGKTTQNVLTVFEVLGLVIVLVVGLFLAPTAPQGATQTTASSWSGIGLAMIFVLFTYGGWNDGAYISAEVRDRERNMSRALFYSLGLVTALYVLVNLAYVKGLGFAGVAKSDAVAADLLARVWGVGGEKLISVMIAVATLTSINGAMIVGARSNSALGREWPFLRILGHWDQASGSPRNAYLVQGAIALLLVGLGAIERKGFQTLVDFTAPVFWAFFLVTGLSLFALRSRDPGAARPYKVPFYPVTPALFVLSCAYMLYSSLAYTGVGALFGVGVLALGAVVMLLGQRAARA